MYISISIFSSAFSLPGDGVCLMVQEGGTYLRTFDKSTPGKIGTVNGLCRKR